VKHRRLFTSLLLAALLAVPVVAQAQDTAAARRHTISERCQNIQLLLNELQRRDLVSRTNLGREYESTARLFTAFIQRVRNNNLNVQEFERLASQFNDATSQFRSAYVQYDDSLIKLQEIDCRAKPGDFDSQLAQTRTLRDATEGSSTHAAAIAGQYHTQMVQLQANLPEQAQKENR
jgi:hypothetical protein